MEVGGHRQASAPLLTEKILGTHCTGGWVGARAGLDGCRKSRPLPGFNPQTAQPVAGPTYRLRYLGLPRSLLSPGMEPRLFGCPPRSLITVLNTLYRLPDR
jgi:hypothetical protein